MHVYLSACKLFICCKFSIFFFFFFQWIRYYCLNIQFGNIVMCNKTACISTYDLILLLWCIFWHKKYLPCAVFSSLHWLIFCTFICVLMNDIRWIFCEYRGFCQGFVLYLGMSIWREGGVKKNHLCLTVTTPLSVLSHVTWLLMSVEHL